MTWLISAFFCPDALVADAAALNVADPLFQGCELGVNVDLLVAAFQLFGLCDPALRVVCGDVRDRFLDRLGIPQNASSPFQRLDALDEIAFLDALRQLGNGIVA